MAIGAKNLYVCQTCRNVVVTIDRDEGVTPFMIRCRALSNCTGMMHSVCYQIPEKYRDKEPTFEWYKPNIKDVSIQNRAHVHSGGLLLRRIGEDAKSSGATSST